MFADGTVTVSLDGECADEEKKEVSPKCQSYCLVSYWFCIEVSNKIDITMAVDFKMGC